MSVPAIGQHLKRIDVDNELGREATVKQYLMVQFEGERAVQWRKWAIPIGKEYTISGRGHGRRSPKELQKRADLRHHVHRKLLALVHNDSDYEKPHRFQHQPLVNRVARE